MCQKNGLRRFYLLLQNTPTFKTPLVMGIVKADPRTNELYKHFMIEGNPNYLSKRSIELWGYTPPQNPMVQVVPLEVDTMWMLRAPQMK
jgi:hypothetical protein